MTQPTSALWPILQATESLRQSLSLSQLVPVYHSILKLTQTDISTTTSVNEVDDALHQDDAQQPTPAERLLHIQYRLFHSDLTCIWDKLTSIVIPSIASPNRTNALTVDLVEAVLDALFLEHDATNGLEIFTSDSIQRQFTNDDMDWNASCRILARIARQWPEASQNAVRTRICQGFERPMEDLPILVETLLPLYQPQDDEASNELWDAMKLHYQTKLIHCSTILCCIPLVNPPDWVNDLILACLSHSKRLLRRRGIYMLSQTSADDSTWKEYANCFEALEMESETHLLQPVWDVVESLHASIPNEWMQVLYRASFDYTESNSRKTNLHRFLTMKSALPVVTVEFVAQSLIPAVDSVVRSGSIGILFGDSKRTVQRTTLLNLLCTFLNQFLKDVDDWSDLMTEFWRIDLFEKTRDSINRSLVWNSNNTVQVSQGLLESVLHSRRYSTVSRRFRESTQDALATMLSHATKTTAPPKMVLSTLYLFLTEEKPPRNDIEDLLKRWLKEYPASIVATAFVDGQLLEGAEATEQDARTGYVTPTEVELAPAAAYASRLTQEPLWPAIAKGMSNSLRTERMARAILLIEYGCRYECISGMGNGALLMDKQDTMMPPPPNIEAQILSAVSFIEATTIKLLEMTESAQKSGRSDEAKTRSLTYCRMLSHLEAICKGFPNSMNLDTALQSLSQRNRAIENVVQLALLYAALSCGTAVDRPSELVACILKMKFPRSTSTTTRSVFVLAKWGSLSHLISDVDSSIPENLKLLESFLEEALEAVDSAPRNAIIPLFHCILTGGKAQLLAKEKYSASLIKKIADAIFGLLEDTPKIFEQLYMLDQLCKLLFEPTYLLAEYLKLEKKSTSKAPIRHCFRRMMEMAGTTRPHIARVVLLRACASWLQPHPQGVGLTAIPYRDDVLRLLLQKEKALDDEFISTTDDMGMEDPMGLQIAQRRINEYGVSRAILVVFLSRLPTWEQGLCDKVSSDFVHYILLKAIVVANEYVAKQRSLETMCILAKFVTLDVIQPVMKGSFGALGPHNSPHTLRYFAEIFCIQCSRMFPSEFGQTLLKKIRNTTASNQEIASLMIVAGNLIVGRYHNDFMISGRSPVDNMELVRATLPWLSSTQAFTRGIAQLLSHALISKLKEDDPGAVDDSFLLADAFCFLDEHPEMKRLRSKQQAFFDQYDADASCTAEGLLALPIDDSGESAPFHLVDVLKECFRELYDDVTENDYKPMWKRTDAERATQMSTVSQPNPMDGFQRKIIPVDALNLLLEDEKTQGIRNKAGRRKQDLIVCASLIDKVPNLGGLARTSEIFAARKLVVPDITVAKMDNFSSISAGAGDWLDIEECCEKVRPLLQERCATE